MAASDEIIGKEVGFEKDKIYNLGGSTGVARDNGSYKWLFYSNDYHFGKQLLGQLYMATNFRRDYLWIDVFFHCPSSTEETARNAENVAITSDRG